MSPTRIAAVALLVAVAGCTGFAGNDAQQRQPTDATTTELTTTDPTTDDPTTGGMDETGGADTTEPHTAVGTSHAGTHLVVNDYTDAGNVTVTVDPIGGNQTYAVANRSLDLSREIHERGHGVRVVVERGNETVFDQLVRGYEYYEVNVDDKHTSVEQAVV